ncbi:MAG: hypothetical protein JWR62_400 [Modestobacter sp.]|nr:hypothetical protein [Modestobacter sp.]
MRRGWEPGHVPAGLGEDHLRHLRPDSGNGLQWFQLVRPGLAGCRDHRVELGEGVLGQLQPMQHGARPLGVLVVEVPGQRLDQLRDLDPHLALGHFGEDLRITFAGDQRGQHRPGRDAGQARRHREQLDARVLQHEFQAGHLAGAVGHQLHPVAGRHLQPADVGRRHERRADQPVLEQLGDPLGVLDVGLGSLHRRDVRGVAEPDLQNFLQAVESRRPVRRGRLHRRDRHPALQQPVAHDLQRAGGWDCPDSMATGLPTV